MSQSNDEFNEELASGQCPVLEKASHWGRKASDNLKQRIESKKAQMPESKVSLSDLLGKFKAQVQGLIRDEIGLAKSKFKSLLARILLGVVCLLAAAVFALFMLGWILKALGELLILAGLPAWAAALSVAGLLLVVTLICVGCGVAFLKKGLADPPAPAKGLKADVEAVKKGMR